MTIKKLQTIADTISNRSRQTRADYLKMLDATKSNYPPRKSLSCGNLAHGFAACSSSDKNTIKLVDSVNIGIVSAYNDMLSAHQPLQFYPDIIKDTARAFGSTAQVAGGVPAMCDGVTQGKPGMELSLFSRDVIALATAVSLSHNMFNANLMLGVCDKIVPGLLIGSLQFGHLPTAFISAGPMPTGIPNIEKAKVRQQFARGEVGEDKLLETESKSYHSPGTCTFYGTANSNQVVVELLGLQLAGSSFVQPNDPMRQHLIKATVAKLIAAANAGKTMADMVTVEAVINATVALLATGGSTNLAIHLIAIAKAAGIILTVADIGAISALTPLIARVYPNGSADVNQFQRAGGIGFVVKSLLEKQLLFADVATIMGRGIEHYATAPVLIDNKLQWQPVATKSKDTSVLVDCNNAFDNEGGLKIVAGNIGSAIVKVSAVAKQHRLVQATCIVLDNQNQLQQLFDSKQLDRDVIVVVRFQCSNSNGMPELHKLTPFLGSLQDAGFKVALVTDGRMSGASGKVPAAIHLTPSANNGGLLAKLETGDHITLDVEQGLLTVANHTEISNREASKQPIVEQNLGRNLFSVFRENCSSVDTGSSVF